MKLKPFIYALLFSSLSTSASYAFFCPNGFNQINFGDTLAQVESACGKADKTETADAPDSSPQEWNYYIQQPASMNLAVQNQQGESSLKGTFAFDASGKLINITVNGIGVGSTNNCGSIVSIGDTRKAVEAACGKPAFVQKQAPSDTNKEPAKQVELTYNGSPPVKLIFREGVLAEKQ